MDCRSMEVLQSVVSVQVTCSSAQNLIHWVSRRGNLEADVLAKRGVGLSEMYRVNLFTNDFFDDQWQPS